MTVQSPDGIGRKIDAALAAKDWASGADLLELWCEQHPDNARGWFFKAICLHRLGRLNEAGASVQRALELSPEDAGALALERRLWQEAEKKKADGKDGLHSPPAHDPNMPPPTLTDGGDASPPQPDPPPETVLASAVPSADPARLDSELFLNLTEKQQAPWKTGAVIDGHYEVRDVVHGGMGVVYFVFDTEMALELAVKTPLPKALSTQSGRARFLREAEAWIGLGLHPNICSAYYVRTLGGIPRLFIEYIDGGSLDQWIKRELLAPALERLDLAIQIASGMHHAHTFTWVDEDGERHQGVVHRDLKPANVLIGSDGVARVTDFGLVGRGTDAEEPILPEGNADLTAPTGGIWGTVTLGGSAIGTPPYMPPEQWNRAHLADKPADVYAFGCILFELFCGRRPFSLDDGQRRARPEAQLLFWRDLHCKATPPDPQEVEPHVDEALASLITCCLAKDPDDRPPGFDTLRQQLKDIYSRLAGKKYPRPEPQATRLTADALNNRGVSFVSLGQEQRAERAWREALAVDPHHTEANYNLALFRWRARAASDPDTSVSMEEVRRSQVSIWKDEHLSGRVALLLGRYNDALLSLRRAVRASKGSPEVARDCGLALCAMARETGKQDLWQEACDLLSRCGGPLRKDPTLLAAYSLAQLSLGNIHVAVRLYESARQRSEDLPEALDDGTRRVLPGLHMRRRMKGLSGRVYDLSADVTAGTAATLLRDGTITIWNCSEGAATRTLNPKGSRPRCIALSASGEHLLTATEGDPINVWDLRSGMPVYRLQPHSGFLNTLKVSDDGCKAAAVGTIGTVVVWDLTERTAIGNYSIHEGFLSCLAIAEDHHTCVTAGSDGFVAVVDLDTGRIIARPTGHDRVVTAVSIDSKSKLGASGDESGTLLIWDARTGVRRHRLAGHTGAIRYVSVKRGGEFCLSSSADGTTRIWALDNGRPVFSVQSSAEIHAAFSTRTWNTIIVNEGGSRLLNWRLDEVSTYTPAWAIATPVSVVEAEDRAAEFSEKIKAARALAADNLHLEALGLLEQARSISGYERMSEALDLSAEVTSGFPHEDLNAGWEERAVEAHTGRVTGLAINDRGSHLATAGADRRVVLWNIESSSIEFEWDAGRRPETTVAFVPGTESIISGGLGNDLHLRSIDSSDSFVAFTGHDAQINQIVSDRRGQRFLSASTDGTARLWDIETGICLRILSGHSSEVLCCCLSPDGRFAATGGNDGIIIWDLESGNEVGLFTETQGAVNDLVWSNDGRFLVSAGRDAVLRRWDIVDESCVHALECGAALLSVSLSPDDRFAAAGDKDGKVWLWDIRTATRLRIFAGHQRGAMATEFDPDGHRLFTAGGDGLLKVWYLDWKATVPPDVNWDVRLEPYLEVFLAGSDSGTGRPRWSRSDLNALATDLSRRGFGWVNEDRIGERLRTMTLQWKGHTTVGAALLERAGARRRPRSAKRRQVINLRRRAIAVTSLCLVVFSLIAWNRISYRNIHFDKRAVGESRRVVLESVVPPIPEFTKFASCDQGRFSEYLDTFTNFEGKLWEIEVSRHCLESLGDPAAVNPALDMLRPRPRPDGQGGSRSEFRPAGTYTDVLSLLTRMGDANCNNLAEALSDPDPLVRTVAVRALAYRGSEQSIRVLVDRSEHREPLVRIAVSSVLREIVSSGRLSRRQALRLYEKLAMDTWPEVRRNVAANLPILAGGGARKLARDLANDRDVEVRKLAAKALDEMG